MSTQDTQVTPNDEQISLLEALVVLARHKRLVVVFPLVCSLIAAVIGLILPNIYTGVARILPPQQGGSPITAILMGDTSALNAGSSVGQALGLRNPSDLYVGMLQSRTIIDSMITRFDLQKLYSKDTLTETREKLSRLSRITAGHDGIITIEVDDEDPKRAAEMANTYVSELDALTQTVSVTSAGRQRVFMEKQLRQAKDHLADAEVALRITQEKTGLISVTDQGKAMIESVASLRALIAAKQVQLVTMRTSSTENNPDYVRAQQELAGLRQELVKLEKSNPSDSSAVIPSAASIPEAGLEYVRKYRDVQYYQALFELLAKQYEIARSQEAAESGVIQVLDRATLPDKKSSPHRSLIVLVTGLLAGIFGMVLAFAVEAKDRAASDPVYSQHVDELRRHLLDWRSYLKRP